MNHNLDLILTLTGGFTAALVFGFVSQRLRLSPIVGYLLAGVVVGPFTPGFVAHGDLAEQLAEVGVILLMFGVGLHFHLSDLLAVRRVALPGALVQIALATGLGLAVALAAGWTVAGGIIFGLSISVASTVVLLRVLADADALHTPSGHIAVGWLIVEDIFTVIVLVLLPVLVGGAQAATPAQVAGATAIALLKVAGLVAFTLAIGKRAIPALLGYVAKAKSRELFTLTVLVIALGIAVGSAQLFGVSMALGAFLAGMVVGQSEFSSRAASEALPMRDAFAVLFFVSVGMLFDPTEIGAHLGLTLATCAVILIGKPLAAFAVVRLMRYPVKTAVDVAIALAQIGEFSFILAAVARKVGVMPESAAQILVASSIVSITLNPLLFRWAEPIARKLSARPRARSAVESPGLLDLDLEPRDAEHRAIVVGYGPVGRTLVRLLRENQIAPVVIELNHATTVELVREGIACVHGDASQIEILEQAGVRAARSLIYAASGTPADAVVQAAKGLNPELQVLARSAYLREIPAARRAGAHVVVSAEGEVAMAMTEHLLLELGATGEQLDRTRERLRRELFDGSH